MQPGVSSVLIGARTVEQLDFNLAAGGLQLTQEDLETLDAASRPDWGYPYDFIGQRQPW